MSFYERIDAPATPDQKELLQTLSPDQINVKELAGEKIGAKLSLLLVTASHSVGSR